MSTVKGILSSRRGKSWRTRGYSTLCAVCGKELLGKYCVMRKRSSTPKAWCVGHRYAKAVYET